jgi:hypothetical protein
VKAGGLDRVAGGAFADRAEVHRNTKPVRGGLVLGGDRRAGKHQPTGAKPARDRAQQRGVHRRRDMAERVEGRHRVDRFRPQRDLGHVGPDKSRPWGRLSCQQQLYAGQVDTEHPVPDREQSGHRLTGSAAEVDHGAACGQQPHQLVQEVEAYRATAGPVPIPRAEGVIAGLHHTASLAHHPILSRRRNTRFCRCEAGRLSSLVLVSGKSERPAARSVVADYHHAQLGELVARVGRPSIATGPASSTRSRSITFSSTTPGRRRSCGSSATPSRWRWQRR